PTAPTAPTTPAAPSEPAVHAASQAASEPAPPEPGKAVDRVRIRIDRDGIRVTPHAQLAQNAEQAASAAGQAASAARRAGDSAVAAAEQGLRRAGSASNAGSAGGLGKAEIHAAFEAARREIESAVREAQRAAEEAARDAAEAHRDAEEALAQISRAGERDERERRGMRTTRIGIGDFLMQLTFLWVIASAIIKFTYKGRMQAEVKAARATETAEAESLKRQVVEARMAAMQAQVEPHFLFNTLASIDHLIETDPPRASQMQKNLIALLRASMPTMREASGQGGLGGNGVRDLGREIAVIRPYLEILKVRMEERLATDIAVPDGLLSAEFPPMMIQTLVENAIKHGLEPKPEGGQLRVAAEIVHGKLQMTVADTGLGFGKAGSSGSTAGTGVGLANVRERLQMLYGNKASLTVTENQPSGTVVTITVPYRTVEGAMA
ncbi:MAG: histidine kinase, partial [Rubrivivax sp.]|nr:histidine kinase [Rubrivivax sp.]